MKAFCFVCLFTLASFSSFAETTTTGKQPILYKFTPDANHLKSCTKSGFIGSFKIHMADQYTARFTFVDTGHYFDVIDRDKNPQRYFSWVEVVYGPPAKIKADINLDTGRLLFIYWRPADNIDIDCRGSFQKI